MGVFLHLDIIPERISKDRWSEVYQETLTLLEELPLLTRSKDENGYYYAEHSVHRENIIDGYGGWRAEGDLQTGPNMEPFYLIDDIAYYGERSLDDQGNPDILLSLVRFDGENHQVVAPSTVGVWGAKTQGKRGHGYLLAIGCLICHRLPDAAIIYGDITAAQCRVAVEWANQHLKEPIDVPVTADVTRLLPRLQASGLDEKDLLPAFFDLTLEPERDSIGDFLRTHLPARVLEEYFKPLFLPRERDPERLYLERRQVKRYLELGWDIRALCRMILTEPDGNRLAPRELLRVFLEMKLHVPLAEKVLYDFTMRSKAKGSTAPDTVESMLFSAFFMMHGGGNRNVAAYLPLETICDVMEETVGAGEYMVMAKDLLEEIEGSDMNAGQNEIYDGENSVFRTLSENAETQEGVDEQTYDIESKEEVIDYADGDTVKPELHGALLNYAKQLREIGKKRYRECVKELNEERRKEFFWRNYHTLIPKSVEDKFFARIMDEDYIVRYVGLYSVEVTDNIYWVIRGFLWNPELLDYYWSLSE